MKTDTLYNIFKAKYNSENWKSLLKELFRNNVDANFLQNPINLKNDELLKHQDVEYIHDFGFVSLSDQSQIRLFEVKLNEHQQVTKNRVGLRNIISSEILEGDGAIISYFNPSASDWRFTFLSKELYWDEDNNEIRKETHPKRYTYLLGENESVKTAVSQFEWLFRTIQVEDVELKHFLKAFSVEKLSKEFYRGYFQNYKAFVGYLNDNHEASSLFIKQVKKMGYSNEEDFNNKKEYLIRRFTKKMLGRFIFLYFLQKKGWLGVNPDAEWGTGPRDFINHLFHDSRDKNNFYRDALAPLFFDTLNNDRRGVQNDIFIVTNTRIPYLNGGLFEPDDFEPREIQFDQKLFEDLIEFFERFNFTIDENSPEDMDIGIDPEMLGHIFENQLEDNKDKGAFYTPRIIVQYMCQQSIIEFLKNSIDSEKHEEVETIVKTKTNPSLNLDLLEEIELLLKDVKICDPAIGSGAFPMGILQEIFALRSLIAFESGYSEFSPAKIKERIIEKSIYGVDIEEGAVDIARLRFWLSLIVDEPTPRPLPNLDYKIICGNSLLSRFSLDEKITSVFKEYNKKNKDDNMTLTKFKQLVNDFMHEDNHDKKLDFKKIIQDVKDAFRVTLGNTDKEKISKARGKIVELEICDLYGKIRGSKKEIATAKKELKIIEEKQKKSISGELLKDAVEWRFEFPNLLDSDGNFTGFDIVIGNPPYIQLQNNQGALSNLYKPMDFKTHERTGDIYALFYEKGINLLKKGGHLCYITSNKWMRANYGKSLRKFFANRNPVKLLDLGSGVFKTATVDTNILIIQNSSSQKNLKAVTLNSKIRLDNLTKQSFTNLNNVSSESWIILSPIEQSIKEKIEAVGTPLKEWDITINRGILTGFNEAFIIDGQTKDLLISEDPKSAEILRPILRGRDIKRYEAEHKDLWLINTHNGIKSKNIPRIDVNNYPAIKRHLDQYYSRLEKRADKGDTPYNLRNCAYMEDFFRPKIVYPETTQGPFFYYDDNNMFLDKTCFFCIGKDVNMTLVSQLGSLLFHFAYKIFYSSVELGNKGYQYNKHAFTKLPVSKLFGNNYTKSSNFTLDDLVFKHYGISSKEIEYIKNHTT